MSKKKEEPRRYILVTRKMLDELIDEMDSKLEELGCDDHYINTDKTIIYTLSQGSDNSIHCTFDAELMVRVNDEFVIEAENINE